MHSSPSDQVEAFQKIVDNKVEELFPERKVRITTQDKQFITAELKTLDRKKKKEWKRHGRSEEYRRIKGEFDMKYKKAANSYLKKAVSTLKNENPGKQQKL